MKMFFQEILLHESVIERVKNESHTRLYLSAKNILKDLESNIKNMIMIQVIILIDLLSF